MVTLIQYPVFQVQHEYLYDLYYLARVLSRILYWGVVLKTILFTQSIHKGSITS